MVVIKIEDREDRLNQSGDQQARWKEQFFFVISEGEGRAHPARVDLCSLVRGEVDHHRGARLEVTLNADDEYDPLVPSK